jgi:hypothetical protein
MAEESESVVVTVASAAQLTVEKEEVVQRATVVRLLAETAVMVRAVSETKAAMVVETVVVVAAWLTETAGKSAATGTTAELLEIAVAAVALWGRTAEAAQPMTVLPTD